MFQVAFLFILLSYIYCANILFIAPLPSPSHYLWNKILAKELVKNGHNVTLLTHDFDASAVENYTVITMEGFYDYLTNSFSVEDYLSESNIISIIFQNANYGEMICRYDVETKGFKTLIDYPINFKFDLIIFDITVPTCLYGFISRFHYPPVVGVTAFILAPHMALSFGNPLHTSYMPYYCSKFTIHMNLLERLYNSIYTWLDIMAYRYIAIPKHNEIARNVFGDDTISVEKVERNISLLLVNTDPVLDYPIALAPNIIPIGGLHARPAKGLPDNLETIYKQAKHGVILFSLGTNVKSDFLKKNSSDLLLKVFGKLKQVVIWKYETGELENLPNNVYIRKWLPQNDMLGHPKTVLFITHCGSLGTQEAMYHGVPMVGIPIFIDQHLNAAKLAHKKIASYLNYKNFTFDSIYKTITEVLENPIYKKNIMKISQRYKSSSQTALERGISWIEYILTYGDVHYLNVQGRDMRMYEMLNWDCLALMILCLIIIYIVTKVFVKPIIWCIFKPILSFIFKRKHIKEKVA